MTRPWAEIAAFYDCHTDVGPSVSALAALARRIGESPLASGLFAWTSHLELCIVQTEVSYPYSGPFLRLSPVSNDEIALRYEDSHVEAKQWHRTVAAERTFERLIKFLDQLRWFPSETLAPLHAAVGKENAG